MAAASSSTAQDDSLKYLVLFLSNFFNLLIYIIAFTVFHFSARENAVDLNAE
jgi:hypothetical protein